MSENSVTTWIDQLKAGEPDAARKILERYFDKLIRLAKKMLHNAPKKIADEEDVALKALDSFFRGLEKQRFPQLNDRQDLWKLLVALTDQKTRKLKRRELAQKRGAGKVRGEVDLHAHTEAPALGMGDVAGADPSPAFALLMNEELRERFVALQEPELKLVALFKMEGYTNQEIADKIECKPRTVERKLHLIRYLWSIDLILADEPTPEFAKPTAAEVDAMIERLGDPDLQAIARAKLTGTSHGELATARACTVEEIADACQKLRAAWL